MDLAFPRVPAAWAAPALISALALLALANVAAPAGHTFALASAYGIESVRGGLNWIGILDASCAITGVGALFIAAHPAGLAFCAGWTLGRFVGENW